MIILIGGATHSGKTVLAKKLVAKTGFSCLSIDHLKMGLIRAGYTNLTPMHPDEELTEYLWPIVREMIKTAIENSQDLIIEGCYIPATWRNDFDDSYLANIQAIFLVMSEQYIKDNFHLIKAHAHDAEQRIDDSWLTPELLAQENRALKQRLDDAGELYELIDASYPDVDSMAASLWN